MVGRTDTAGQTHFVGAEQENSYNARERYHGIPGTRSLVGKVANVTALVLGNLEEDVLEPLVLLAPHDLRVSPLHGGQNEVGRAHLGQPTLGRKHELGPTIARVRSPLHVSQSFQFVDK